jgi:hypothetical protein
LALFPFRQRFVELGVWRGGAAFAGIIFIVGYVAAAGGMIEHFVWFNEYPPKFALITTIEILIQTALMGPWVVSWCRRFKVAVSGDATPVHNAVNATA